MTDQKCTPIEPIKKQRNNEVVDVLQRLLYKANVGDIDSIVCIYEVSGGFASEWSGVDKLVHLISYIDILKAQQMRRFLDDK